MELSKIPPICQKRTLAFVNHFIISTVSFLNKFMQSCESKLQMFDQRMQRLEASLFILEAKLSSIPGLEVNITPKVEDSSAETAESARREETKPVSAESSKEKEDTGENSIEQEASSTLEDPQPKEVNPILEKYKKMVHVGVPVQAVRLKMSQDGVDPNLLNL